MTRLRLARLALCAGALLAPPAHADGADSPDNGDGAAAPSVPVLHLHSNRRLGRVRKTPAHRGEDWKFELDAGASATVFGGRFPLQDQSSHFADLYASRKGAKFGLRFTHDEEFGRTDRTLGFSAAVPVSPMLNLSLEGDFSLDRAFNPDASVTLGGSYTFAYDAATRTYAAASLSSRLETYRFGTGLSVTPALVMGSTATGVSVTAGYTFGDIYGAAGAPATALSQATYTEGASLGVTVQATPELSFDVLFLPRNRTVTASSKTIETTLRAAVDYAFHEDFTAEFAVEYVGTSLPGFGSLYHSLQYGGTIKWSF